MFIFYMCREPYATYQELLFLLISIVLGIYRDTTFITFPSFPTNDFFSSNLNYKVKICVNFWSR